MSIQPPLRHETYATQTTHNTYAGHIYSAIYAYLKPPPTQATPDDVYTQIISHLNLEGAHMLILLDDEHLRTPYLNWFEYMYETGIIDIRLRTEIPHIPKDYTHARVKWFHIYGTRKFIPTMC
jgi:hypothetical protein